MARAEAAREWYRGLSGLGRGALLGIAIHAGAVLLRGASHIALARWVGQHGFGTYVFVTTLAGLGGVGSALGLPAAMLALIPRYSLGRDGEAFGALLGYSRRLALLTGVPVGIGLSALLLALQREGAAVLALVVAVPLLALLYLQGEFARAQERLLLGLAPLHLGVSASVLAVAVVGASSGRGGSAGMALATFVLAAAFAAWWQARRLPLATLTSPLPATDRRELFALARPGLLTSLLAAAMAQADLLVVGALLGPARLAPYAVAVRLGYLGGLPLLGVSAAVVPSMAHAFARGEREVLQRLARRATRLSLAGALAAALLLGAAAPYVLRWFGPGFEAAVPAMRIVLAGQVVQAATGPIEQVLQATGFGTKAAPAFVLGVLVLIALTALGATSAGIEGAAAGAVAALAAWNAMMFWLVRRYLGVRMCAV